MRTVDVAVVGAGPAGLSAALRVRWVKAYRGVPSSVTLYDPAAPGGLATMVAARLTGPTSAPMINDVLADVAALRIPIEPLAIESARYEGNRWLLRAGGQTVCAARAIVLATGLRRLSNEGRYFNRGFSLTHNGYDYILGHLESLTAFDAIRSVVIIGNRKTANLLPILNLLRERRPNTELTFVLDEAPSENVGCLFRPSKVLFGRVAELRGSERVTDLVCTNGETVPCDLAFTDYAAFELQPERSIALEGLAYDASGFVAVSRDGSTNLAGAFAAGDATGIYAMALKAFSEGAIAGFSAHRYVYGQKFGHAPPLFAYAAVDRPIDASECDYPVALAGYDIEIIGDPAEASRIIGETVSGKIAFGDLAARLNADKARRW